MPSRFLRLGVPLAFLAVAGCEGVEPCHDGVAVAISQATGFTDDGTFSRAISPPAGTYVVTVAADDFRDVWTFSLSNAAESEGETVSSDTCTDRLRVVTSGPSFAIVVQHPALDADEIEIGVSRNGVPVGSTTALIDYARPSAADTACRVETCRQARIESRSTSGAGRRGAGIA